MSKDKKNDTSVMLKKNGPIVIDGSFKLTLDDGEEVVKDRVVLCRCGYSNIMPFCDASHNRMGFQS